ncbi:hypothetical protein ruthe_02110 [Rubellimicrobium thermophilum DSM 16684]|uniref:Uncharacterized protein n=1 Tax=Rubellimicrobium thermophilum DSM 16684 TaxID=1123069 RepID=S9S310_9RHOB|nr:hypothetical protein [Rubellimicrobium thermophilum]EPX84565.1 hypothetical protein ruthe_02110 [Rubellimicrobium thermophilum DSM 16684]
MIRRWPDSLPPPVGRGYRLELADNARRTQFEIAVRARRITAVRRDRPTLAVRLTDAEFAAFRAWWGDEAWSLAGASDTLADWAATGATVTTGGAIGPDLVACDVLVEDASTGYHSVLRALTDPGWTANDRCTAVVSLLPIGRGGARVGIFGRDGTHRFATVDLGARTVTAVSSEIEAAVTPVGAWTRLCITAPVHSGSDPVRVRIAAMNGNETFYAGSGSAAIAVAQINARRGGREAGVFVPTRAEGTALGTAGGSAWFRCPIAVGGGHVLREVLPLGPATAEPRPSLAWEVAIPVEARDA